MQNKSEFKVSAVKEENTAVSGSQDNIVMFVLMYKKEMVLQYIVIAKYMYM